MQLSTSNRSALCITAAAVVLMLLGSPAFAQTFNETATTFRKFASKTRTGISYRAYVTALADVDFATSEYAGNADAANKSNAEGFQAALKIYMNAKTAWELYIEYVVGNGKKESWQDFFITKVGPQFCTGARLYSRDDILEDCLSKNWQEAEAIIAKLHEERPQPPATPPTNSTPRPRKKA